MADAAHRVLVLDDDEDFCELLGAFLEVTAGAVCVMTRSLADLVRRREAALACDLAILDVNLGPAQPSGIDALDWLRVNAFGGRVVFLTGHARLHPRLGEEARTTGVQVLEKPVAVDRLLALLGPR